MFDFLSKITKTTQSWEAQQRNAALEQQEAAAVDATNTAVQPALANNGSQVVAPSTKSSVVVPVAKSLVPEAETMEVYIDTEGKLTSTLVVIGCDSIYRANNPNFTGNPVNVVYAGSQEANLYDVIIQELRQNTYTLLGVSIETSATLADTSNGENAKRMLSQNWLQVAGGHDGSYATKPIQIASAKDPYIQNGTNVLYYPFVGSEGRLDSLTCYAVTVLPNVRMKLRFSVASRVSGRQA